MKELNYIIFEKSYIIHTSLEVAIHYNALPLLV
jgi:hypothetical protein